MHDCMMSAASFCWRHHFLCSVVSASQCTSYHCTLCPPYGPSLRTWLTSSSGVSSDEEHAGKIFTAISTAAITIALFIVSGSLFLLHPAFKKMDLGVIEWVEFSMKFCASRVESGKTAAAGGKPRIFAAVKKARIESVFHWIHCAGQVMVLAPHPLICMVLLPFQAFGSGSSAVCASPRACQCRCQDFAG